LHLTLTIGWARLAARSAWSSPRRSGGELPDFHVRQQGEESLRQAVRRVHQHSLRHEHALRNRSRRGSTRRRSSLLAYRERRGRDHRQPVLRRRRANRHALDAACRFKAGKGERAR
jgi:hypothetical protein